MGVDTLWRDLNLWLDVRIGPPLIDWFNRTARPTDIARIENVNQMAQLDAITTGRKMVVFKSVAEAERHVAPSCLLLMAGAFLLGALGGALATRQIYKRELTRYPFIL